MNHVYPKDSYIGSPIKNVAHVCALCRDPRCPGANGKPCTHGHHGHECAHCGGKGCEHCGHGTGLCMAVVDDANNRVYLYGHIVHENYHVPGNQCIAWTGVESAGFTHVGRMNGDEWFEGEQDNNTVRLKECPVMDGSLMVFLNGVKQREGNEHDYIINGNEIHFNFYDLLPTDVVEVMYAYGAK